MSDEQGKKPTQKFGSMKEQWETIGGGKGTTDMQGTLTQKHQDAKTSEHEPEEKMKRQTVYMPEELATWLKIHAAIIKDDISGIITRLVEEYKDEVERNK